MSGPQMSVLKYRSSNVGYSNVGPQMLILTCRYAIFIDVQKYPVNNYSLALLRDSGIFPEEALTTPSDSNDSLRTAHKFVPKVAICAKSNKNGQLLLEKHF